MPLSRIGAICRVLKLDFADLARRVADMQLLLAEMTEMTEAQERAVVADKKLLLCAICQALAPSLLKRCCAWPRTSPSSTRVTQSKRTKAAKATPCCWLCVAESFKSLRACGAELLRPLNAIISGAIGAHIR